MSPRLLHGDVVLVTRWFSRPKIGDVVVVYHDGREKIKRITKIGKNRVYITGDNRLMSTDSRDFGWLEREYVIAKLLWPRA